jgi:serine/threonine protein kinase
MEKFDGRYKIVKSLGSGLSGEVLLVEDDEVLKALKVLKRVQFKVSKEEALQNFKSEFAILSELNHPGIARILDFGLESRLNKYYFSTEFIEGEDIFNASNQLSFEEIEDLIVQVLRALNYLHQRGIYHFDIKPQNILVDLKSKPNVAKIIDFGLAGFSSPKKRVGTPSYMAPEVILGGNLDNRTDLYSFGVVIYKMLTKENPFKSSKVEESYDRHKNFIPPKPSEVDENIPKFWDQIVLRLLEKSPSRRYSEASQVIRDINFLANRRHDIETKDTRLSYLPDKGGLIARDNQTKKFQDYFKKIFKEDNLLISRLFVVEGAEGSGKTRLLSEFKYHSQLNEVPVYSWKQYQETNPNPPFSIHIDSTDNVRPLEILQLLQIYHQQAVGIIWATKSAPKNWTDIEIVHLSNFSIEELTQYLTQVTGLKNPPLKLVEEIYQRSEGNPLIVTEILRNLLAENLLLDSSGRWASTTFEDIGIDFEKIKTPRSVSELMRHQYESQPKDEKRILDWLAVINESISLSELSILMKDQFQQNSLLNLIQANLIERSEETKNYFFKNILFRDVVYNQLENQFKEKIHDQLAIYYQDTNKPSHVIHFHQGFGSNVSVAVNALKKLAQYYLELEKISIASEYLEIATRKANSLDLKTQFEVEKLLAFSYFRSGRFKQALDHYLHLRSFINQYLNLIDFKERISVYEKLGSVYSAMDKHQLALELFDKIILWLNEVSYDLMTDILIQNHRANVMMRSGQLEEAERIFRANRIKWETELSDDEKEKVTNNLLVDVLIIKGKYDEALDCIEKDISFFENKKQDFSLARSHYLIGDIFYRQMLNETNPDKKDYFKIHAIEGLSQCLDLAKGIDSKDLMLRSYNGIGNLYFQDQEFKLALEYYERALAIARQKEDFYTACFIALNLGNIHRQLNSLQDAYSYLTYTLNILEDFSDKNTSIIDLKLRALVEISEACRKLNEFYKSENFINQAETLLFNHSHLKNYFFSIWFQKAQLYYAQEHYALCRDCLRKAKKHAKHSWELDELQKFEDQISHEFLTHPVDISLSESTEQSSLISGSNIELKEKFGDVIEKFEGFLNQVDDEKKLFSLIANLMNLHQEKELIPKKENLIENKEISIIPLDDKNIYDPNLNWEDYQKLIFQKAYNYFEGDKKKLAKYLDVSISSIYQKIKLYHLSITINSNHLFNYDPNISLKEYQRAIYQAAKKYSNGRVYEAIKLLEVSPGNFYKITNS